jgi:hypothetical protein
MVFHDANPHLDELPRNERAKMLVQLDRELHTHTTNTHTTNKANQMASKHERGTRGELGPKSLFATRSCALWLIPSTTRGLTAEVRAIAGCNLGTAEVLPPKLALR